MKGTSSVVSKLLNRMEGGRGTHPLRILYALSTAPVQYRSLNPSGSEKTDIDDIIEKNFGGLYLLTVFASPIINRYLHAEGSIQTFYADKAFYEFLNHHGITDCRLWDEIDTDTLSHEITLNNYDHRWAYSACKPPAISEEIKRSMAFANQTGTAPLPVIFHDSDMVLRTAVDTMLHLNDVNDVTFAYSHQELVGKSPFYPDFSTLSIPERYTLSDNKLIDKNTNRTYSTKLEAVNTCLLYFSPEGFSMGEEFAGLFRGLMKENFLTDYNWLRGEQNLLAFDQRTALMVCDRLGIKATPIMPITWDGTKFLAIDSPSQSKVIWPYYHPEYYSKAEKQTKGGNYIVCRDIMHLWNQKGDMEKHRAYANYTALILLEVIKNICPMVGISWQLLSKALSSFQSLQEYMALLNSPYTLDELLALPVEHRPVSDKLLKDLNEPLAAPSLKIKETEKANKLLNTETFKKESAKYIASSEINAATHIPYSGKGSVYRDTENNSYIDFSGGILTNTFGHGDPEIADALRDGYLQLNNIHGRYSLDTLKFSQKLFRHLPGNDYCLNIYGDGGGYTIDRALTFLYYHFGKQCYRLLTYKEGFHGKTLATKLSISLSENAPIFDSYQIPAPNCSECPCKKNRENCCTECADITEQALEKNGIQVFLFEPVLGSQVIIPPKEYWSRIQKYCKAHGILTLDDEVLVGGGRTGSYLAAEQFGLDPDIIVMTKGVAAGLPCSVLLLRRNLTENSFISRPNEFSSTYYNLPLLLRVADTVLTKIERENILENVVVRGRELSDSLNTLKKSFPGIIKDIRSIGLFGAVEFSNPVTAQLVFITAEMRGLELINSGHILRIGPALNITREELQEGLLILYDIIKEIEHG